jgi:hypothetical protein
MGQGHVGVRCREHESGSRKVKTSYPRFSRSRQRTEQINSLSSKISALILLIGSPPYFSTYNSPAHKTIKKDALIFQKLFEVHELRSSMDSFQLFLMRAFSFVEAETRIDATVHQITPSRLRENKEKPYFTVSRSNRVFLTEWTCNGSYLSKKIPAG